MSSGLFALFAAADKMRLSSYRTSHVLILTLAPTSLQGQRQGQVMVRLLRLFRSLYAH